jgi:hypothetical protein
MAPIERDHPREVPRMIATASRSSAAAPAPGCRRRRGGRRHRPHRHLQFRPLPHGRARLVGGLLAYGNANEIVKEMALEVLPVVKHTPVLAGVNGTDPFVLMPQFLAELKAMGFSGVQNFPTVGLFDGTMRASFEETGMSYGSRST